MKKLFIFSVSLMLIPLINVVSAAPADKAQQSTVVKADIYNQAKSSYPFDYKTPQACAEQAKQQYNGFSLLKGNPKQEKYQQKRIIGVWNK